MFLGNTLYATALIYYSYITFLGYNCSFPSGSALITLSIAVSERDTVTANPDSGDSSIVYHQSLWVSCVESCSGTLFSEVVCALTSGASGIDSNHSVRNLRLTRVTIKLTTSIYVSLPYLVRVADISPGGTFGT